MSAVGAICEMHGLCCASDPLRADHIWLIVNTDVSPGAACVPSYTSESGKLPPQLLPEFICRKGDHSFGALGMKLVHQLECGGGKCPLISLWQRAQDLWQWQEVK